jgi:anti-anti-sigma factor
MAELEFINSTGVAIIFSILSRATDNGGRVVIGGINPFLRNIFSLMELPSGLDVQETIEEAKKSFHF